MSRWIVVITDETGGSSCYGAWRDHEVANEIRKQLTTMSSRYGGPGEEFEVDMHAIQKWPGIRALRKQLLG